VPYRVIPVTSFMQNCTLVWCPETRQAALIDPGGDADRLLDAVAAQGLTLERILLTHGHLDHVGASAELVARTGVPIEGPQREDAFWLEGLQGQVQMFGFPPCASFTPDRWLEQGDTVQVGAQTLQVLHCPGHTPGHVVFHHVQEQWVQVGDVLFQDSVGRSDFPRGNHAELLRSIHDKLLPLGDAVEVIPGHGPTTTLGRERRHNPFLR